MAYRFNRNSFKYVLLVAGLVLVVFLLSFFSGRRNPSTVQQPLSENEALFTQIDRSNQPKEEFGEEAANYEVYESEVPPTLLAAKRNVKLLADDLPFVMELNTSVGIKTKSSMYTFDQDPPYVVRISINGPNYHESAPTLTNPHAIAFIESLNAVKKRVEGHGVDPNQLYYIFTGPDIVQKVSNSWAKEFDLL